MKIHIQPSNIELEGYYVRDLHFSLRSGVDETGLKLSYGLHVQSAPIKPSGFELNAQVNAAGHGTDHSRFRMVLRLASEDSPSEKEFPYNFDVTLVGFFRLVGVKHPSPHHVPEIAQSSIALLFAAARELLASVTGRGPFPALVLPSVRLSLEGLKGKLSDAKPVPSPKERLTLPARKRSSKKK